MDERTAASIGPRDLKQKGSTEWCWQTISWLKSMWQSKTITDQRFSEVLEELAEYKVFEKIPPDNPYGSLDSLLKSEIGVSTSEVQIAIATAQRRIRAAKGTTGEVLPIGAPEHNQNGSKHNSNAQFMHLNYEQSQANRAKQNGIGRATQQKLDYLARNSTDLLHCVQTGELSADRAYKMARGIKDPTPLDNLKKWWGKASQDEKITFLEWAD